METMGQLVSVVLITWNSAPFLGRCLEGIARQTHGDLELIHVDNASADDSVAVVRRAAPHARQILHDSNRGFTGGANAAVRAARGDYVLFCNPDAYLGEDYVAQLVEALQAAGDNFGMATGKLMRAVGTEIAPTDVIDSEGIRMTRTGRHLDINQGRPQQPSNPATQQPTEVFGVSGAAGIYRRSFIDDVSIDGELFDEDFFSYREDADVAWRGRLLGWRALSVPAAVGWHVRTVTPGARRTLSPVINMHGVKNRFLLRLKNEGLYLALRNAPFELARDGVTLAAVLTVERSSLPALAWLWKNRRRIMDKRRAVQRRRRVSDRALAGWFR
jgi:GT2 family glycosyltransferase